MIDFFQKRNQGRPKLIIFFVRLFRDFKTFSCNPGQKDDADAKNIDVSLLKHSFPNIPHVSQVSNLRTDVLFKRM